MFDTDAWHKWLSREYNGCSFPVYRFVPSFCGKSFPRGPWSHRRNDGQKRQFSHFAFSYFRNVRKPRSIEERLLSLFLELYDAYVYSRFVRIRNRQIITESGLGPERLELSRLVIAIWDILNRIIENYAAHVHAMREMKRRFFAPAMEELRRSPHIWNESWKRFETMIRLDEEVDEKEEEEEARSSTCQVERRATGS